MSWFTGGFLNWLKHDDIVNLVKREIIMKTKLFMAKRGWQLTAALGLILSTPLVMGVQPQSTPAQFDISAPIEKFTLDDPANCTPASALYQQGTYIGSAQSKGLSCTATVVLNGQKITLPANTVITYPSSFLTSYETFAYNPLCTGASCTETGLAINDTNRLPNNAHPAHYEASIQGNVIYNAAGNPQYVAGLVRISQQDLNQGEGFINFIDYSTGEIRVGGDIGVATTGERVRLNDPVGRFGRRTGPHGATVDTQDIRFAVDDGNPTVSAQTGYPLCIPRVAPTATTSDPLCPETNRPVGGLTGHITTFYMPVAANVVDPLIGRPAGFPTFMASQGDPTQQAPLEVGDYIYYKGTLAVDATSTYISAYNIQANMGIYTTPGTDPAYVTQEVSIVGVGVSSTFAAPAEGRELFKIVGFSTDVSRPVDTGMVQVDPCSGKEGFNRIVTLFPNGSTLDPTGAAGVNVPLGRFRSVFLKGAALGIPMRPAAKEVQTFIEGSDQQIAANGLTTGTYTAPVSEYIFAENLLLGGMPIVPNNFEDFWFLSLGHGPWDMYDPYNVPTAFDASVPGAVGMNLATSPIQGQLAPWPGTPTAGVTCAAGQNSPPLISASNLTVAAGSSVLVNASVTPVAIGATLQSFSWRLTGATQLNSNGTVSTLNAGAIAKLFGNTAGIPAPNVANLTFTAPNVSKQTVLFFLLTVTDTNNSIATKTVTVTVNPGQAVDTISVTTVPTYRLKDGSWLVNVSGSDPTAVVSLQVFDATLSTTNPTLILAKTVMSQPTPGTGAWLYNGRVTFKPAITASSQLVVRVNSSKGGQAGPTAVSLKLN
jgi:hypothetical protein